MDKFEKAAEKARSKGKGNQTPKKPTKHQLELAEQRKGLGALQEVPVPEHVEEPEVVVEVAPEPAPIAVESENPVEAALQFLKELPAFAQLKKAGELRDRAAQAEKDERLAQKDHAEILDQIRIKHVAMMPIQKSYREECEKARLEILGDPEITMQRSLRDMLRGDYSKIIDQAVNVAISKKPAVVEMQQTLAKRTADIEQLRVKEAAAQNRMVSNRELAAKLVKEANEILASIS